MCVDLLRVTFLAAQTEKQNKNVQKNRAGTHWSGHWDFREIIQSEKKLTCNEIILQSYTKTHRGTEGFTSPS